MIENLSEAQMEEVLEHNFTGRIGCWDGHMVYVVPVSYYYDGKFIIAHSREGLKLTIMRQNPDVCFEVDEMEHMTGWKSVILWGRFEELNDPKERYYALDRLIRKISKLKSGELSQQDLKNYSYYPRPQEIKTIVYRIRVVRRTGRLEKK